MKNLSQKGTFLDDVKIFQSKMSISNIKTVQECAGLTAAQTKRNFGQLNKAVSSFVFNDSLICDIGVVAPITEFPDIPLDSGTSGGLYVRNGCLPKSIHNYHFKSVQRLMVFCRC